MRKTRRQKGQRAKMLKEDQQKIKQLQSADNDSDIEDMPTDILDDEL